MLQIILTYSTVYKENKQTKKHPHKKSIYREKYIYLQNHVLNTNKIIESDCPDEASNHFSTLYNELFNKAFPIVSIKTNK